MGEFNDAELGMISQIMKAEKSLPDDFWAVAVVQELACLLVRIEPLLSDEQVATLVGVGAFVARHGKAEISAEIHMRLAMAKARRPRDEEGTSS